MLLSYFASFLRFNFLCSCLFSHFFLMFLPFILHLFQICFHCFAIFALPAFEQDFHLPAFGQDFHLPAIGQDFHLPAHGQGLHLPAFGQDFHLPAHGQSLHVYLPLCLILPFYTLFFQFFLLSIVNYIELPENRKRTAAIMVI